MASEERDTRIPFRLGTDQYCKFEGCDEYVHMGDLVAVYPYIGRGNSCPHFGTLCGVWYDCDGFISEVTLSTLNKVFDFEDNFDVDFDGVFHHAKVVTDD